MKGQTHYQPETYVIAAILLVLMMAAIWLLTEGCLGG